MTMRAQRPFAFLLLLAGIACVSEEIDVFPEWTIPVPEGTPVREPAVAPAQERTQTIELERDLVLREAFGRGFFRPLDVAAAADGRVFVLDDGNDRVVAFDGDGSPLFEFGRAGGGPGEFAFPTGFGVAGDEVIVSDRGNSRLSVYRIDGTHLTDHVLETPLALRDVVRTGEELVVHVAPSLGMALRGPPHPRVPWFVGRYTPEGAERARLIELTAFNKAVVRSQYIGELPVVVANPIFVLGENGRVFATAGDEYQVAAVGPDGDYLWSLRASWPVEPVTEERQQQLIDAYVASEEIFANATYDWPGRYAAIENLEVDGNGNLWVFPYAYRPYGVDPGLEHLVPVDIYSPDGDLLLSGLSPLAAWDAAHGDHVFRIESDGESGEDVVARYRLAAAWE